MSVIDSMYRAKHRSQLSLRLLPIDLLHGRKMLCVNSIPRDSKDAFMNLIRIFAKLYIIVNLLQQCCAIVKYIYFTSQAHYLHAICVYTVICSQQQKNTPIICAFDLTLENFPHLCLSCASFTALVRTIFRFVRARVPDRTRNSCTPNRIWYILKQRRSWLIKIQTVHIPIPIICNPCSFVAQ